MRITPIRMKIIIQFQLPEGIQSLRKADRRPDLFGAGIGRDYKILKIVRKETCVLPFPKKPQINKP
jgi:hypothetical protein